MTVRYGATVRWQDGSRRPETLCALVDTATLPEGVAVVEGDDGTRIGVWRYPHDPFLPGLANAAYPGGARAILSALGVASERIEVTPLVYRPGARAVLRLRGEGVTVYAKILRPRAVAGLRALHLAFAEQVRVPRLIASSEPLGLVLLEPLHGLPLTRPLVDGGALPDPATLRSLLHQIDRVALPTGTSGTAGDPTSYGLLLSSALPAEQPRIDDLVARAVSGTPAPQRRTVHGDLYQAQLLVADGTLQGVLDVDGARLGAPTDDPATLVAHLIALAHVHPSVAARIDTYRTALVDALGGDVDASQLRLAVLGVLLGLSTTPFRRQEADWAARTRGWLDLCRCWADGENALMHRSPAPHAPRRP
jgi:hypothetical protein